jgi:hypothetical protein
MNRRIHADSALNYDSPHDPARNKPQPHTALHYRHPAHPLPGIDADMREFGQSGIRKHERELLAANRDEIETLSTTLKLRGDCEGRDMAWHLQWLLLKAEKRESIGAAVLVSPPRGHAGFGSDLANEALVHGLVASF